MAKKITVTINGEKVKGNPGITILEFARDNGVDIPALCYHSDLTPIGACRMCVVEVEGSKTLVGSCHTPIQEGMVIKTDSPKVLDTRKATLELILSSHAGDCILCSKANICELRKIATDLNIGGSRFRSQKRFYHLEENCPWMFRDLTKCVLCYRCIWACRELAKKNLLSMGYRGPKNKIICGFDEVLCKKECESCDECVKVCPVGALAKPDTRFYKQKKKVLVTK